MLNDTCKCRWSGKPTIYRKVVFETSHIKIENVFFGRKLEAYSTLWSIVVANESWKAKESGDKDWEKKKRKRRRKRGKKGVERVFFFARRWSQLSTSVISPSLNLVTHQVLRYLSSGVTFEVMLFFFPFVSLLPAVQRKTLTEMPTVTSLSKRMNERFVLICPS